MSQGTDTPHLEPRFGRSIDLIVVHCSATPSGKPLGGGLGDRRVTAPMVIDRWHAERGFARRPDAVRAHAPHLPHIGYHYVIDLDGRIESGRRLREVGAHVAGHNARSAGICLIGGAEAQGRYTPRQWASLRGLVQALLNQVPHARVVGHRDLSPDKNGDGRITSVDWLKTCPGFDVSAWIASGMLPPAAHLVHEPGQETA